MKKLSTWALKNKWAARFIIIVSHFLFIWIGIFLGRSLLQMDLVLPAYLLYFLLFLFILALITYPSRSSVSKNKAAFYRKQKSRDFLLAFSTCCMIICLSNSSQTVYQPLQTAFAAFSINLPPSKTPTAAEILASLEYRDKSTLTRLEKRILKKEFKKQLGVYVVATIKNDKQAKDNAGLVILTIVGALGLFFLLAALSCSIACNGSEGAAIAVFLLGTAGIIIAMIAILKSIKRKGDKKKAESEIEK
jgi:hypothetical protein